MLNDVNKKQLIKFLCDRNITEIHDRDIYFEKSEQCYHLTSTDAEAVAVTSVDVLAPSHEETDARTILHCMHICETAQNTTHI